MEHLMRTLRSCAAVIVVMSFAACTGQPSPARVNEPVYDLADGRVLYMDDVPVSTRTVLQKDYAIGVRRIAQVSEPMLSVKNYTVSDRVLGAVTLEDFEQTCGSSRTADQTQEAVDKEAAIVRCTTAPLSYVRGQRETRFGVGGAFRQGGHLFYMVEFDAAENGLVYIAADTRGRLKTGDYVGHVPLGAATVVTPLGIPFDLVSITDPLPRDRALFRFEVNETIDPLSPNFQHYSLTYQGTTYDYRGMVYHLLYREYRRDGSKNPLFEQSLAFAGETSTIDVLGFRIRVHNVSDKQIIFTVQRDQ
jgi:hypothetical protein